ncbi:MAG: tRNA lysidine(34) synthetase TilS [Ekhidna sp.]
MHSLQKQFHDFIHAKHLVKKGEKVLLAVSGGLDSMVMAHLFLAEKIPFEMAHCNYGLRGDESDGDEAFVMKWADQNGINCFVKAFDLMGSIQLEARKARYQWFDELVAEHNFDKIATAHHLNDSLETILINLSRGTGIKGVAGISMKKAHIIRPMLFAEKQHLYDYAMEQGLEWREDSSNSKTDYDRNLLRHDVVPELLKLNPSLFKNFGLTIERLTHASAIVNARVDDIRSQFLTQKENGFELDLNWIKNSSDELILAELLAVFDVNYVTSKEIFEARGKSGKSFPTNEWLVTMDRNALFIGAVDVEPAEEILIETSGEYELNGHRIIVELVTNEEVVFGASHVAYFDADILKYPFLIRPWREGDKFQPFGMRGSKKVSDYLIDAKIPLVAKKKVLVLECESRVAWLINRRISEAFKISENTSEIIRISFFEKET